MTQPPPGIDACRRKILKLERSLRAANNTGDRKAVKHLGKRLTAANSAYKAAVRTAEASGGGDVT